MLAILASSLTKTSHYPATIRQSICQLDIRHHSDTLNIGQPQVTCDLIAKKSMKSAKSCSHIVNPTPAAEADHHSGYTLYTTLNGLRTLTAHWLCLYRHWCFKPQSLCNAGLMIAANQKRLETFRRHAIKSEYYAHRKHNCWICLKCGVYLGIYAAMHILLTCKRSNYLNLTPCVRLRSYELSIRNESNMSYVVQRRFNFTLTVGYVRAPLFIPVVL